MKTSYSEGERNALIEARNRVNKADTTLLLASGALSRTERVCRWKRALSNVRKAQDATAKALKLLDAELDRASEARRAEMSQAGIF